MNKDTEKIPDYDDFYQDSTSVQPGGKDSETNLLTLLNEALIDPIEAIEAPPVCLQLSSSESWTAIATLGNFSLIIGKAKSRKTFYNTLALAAAIGNEPILNKFQGILPDSQPMVLLFDTEQSKYHAQSTVKRVCKLAGIDQPNNFKAYGLRKFKPSERLALIEAAIYNIPGVGFIVIDGVRDLVTSINDEEQATMLTSKLLKWTEEFNLHIIAVLHQNKNDSNPRGHLGTEMQNKAETVLSVTKDEKDKSISIVEAEYCRDKEPEPFAFEIDEQGLPRLVDHWELKTAKSGNSSKLSATDVADDTHKSVLRLLFVQNPNQLYGELLASIKMNLEMDYAVKIGDNKVRNFIQYYTMKGWITKNNSANSRQRYYCLSMS